MSYDLILFRPAPGVDPQALADMDEPEVGEPDTRPLLTWDEPLVRRLTAALQALHPDWEVSGTEVNHEATGIQISFHDREASLTVPYWHKGPDAAPVFDRIWTCLRAVTESANAIVYDPQRGDVLNLATDKPETLRIYARGVGVLPGAKRPWWKFW